MKILKNVLFMTIVLIVMPCFSQEENVLTTKEKIKYETERLKEAETKLKTSKETFLKELMESEGVNSELIKNQREAIKALELEILTLKSTLFELNEEVRKTNLESNKKPEEIIYANPNIISNYINRKAAAEKKASLSLTAEEKENKGKSSYLQFKDIRNPITFTEFIVRNPRSNGKNVLTPHANASSYNYIKPGSIVNILFNEDIYGKLKGDVKLSISAYLKRFDGTVVPITVSGFFDVEVKTDQTEFETNMVTKSAKDSTKLGYNYTITTTSRGPIQAEINTSMANPQPKDKLIVTVVNVSDGNVSLTTTFEYEDFGWKSSASGGFAWVNTINSGSANFKPAGTSGFSFHYKLNKGERFWAKFFNPSFGPELIVLQDANQNTNIGLGLSVSTILRMVKVGYGWHLVGENGKPYVSIGVNFVEGYKSISSILSRSQE